MIFTFLRSNCGFIFAMYPSSVVQTGVKSLGCENRTAHESPIQSWKLIVPSVVSASKSGAVSPIVRAMRPLLSRLSGQVLLVSAYGPSERGRDDVPQVLLARLARGDREQPLLLERALDEVGHVVLGVAELGDALGRADVAHECPQDVGQRVRPGIGERLARQQL